MSSSLDPETGGSDSHAEPTFEFHVARDARARYGLDEPWFALSGNVVLADLAMSRRLAQRMNVARAADRHPDRAVNAGDLHAMGLIDEILHFVAGLFRRDAAPGALSRALEHLERSLGRAELDAMLLRFTETFPPLAVHRGAEPATAWLAGRSGRLSHREIALEELTLLWLANANPAFAPFVELFDDAGLEADTRYVRAIAALGEFFHAEPRFGPDHQTLPEMLRSPALAAPDSLAGQLDYIRERWGHLLGELLRKLLVAIDVIREEERARFLRFAGAGAISGARVPVPRFEGLEVETEHFSPDRDWMPRAVIVAKSTYVWLDQIARAHGREVSRLDHIPDQELDRLARWGVNGLWLIGLWERSPASQRIKQLCGNPDAAASAYSLRGYGIAADLGGEDAYRNLRDRAAARGIRLASDMVPNHMGVDSHWVLEHPDWFLALDHPPYPSYTFHGPDLSPDSGVGIYLEDHYYDRSDAAVTFMRVDRASGRTRFVYHGNDGTMMPWNDTAQLDYLNPQVREAVIQTILEVARRFPIIRFDAAMTLAKKHYQRLWFPEPGSGGAIPSRAEHGLTKPEFDARMPVEFWREVVDRVAAEAPDTLLLAEAFWLMEGYFVRTLGMHRVYNSAFMNMLRDEENANYRSVIKNTLEFDPDILKRYVNFMNNPDERTAVDQFGKDDKYFGVCTLMVTLPGLPMFGHGQIEGYTEKYGMEFRRASQHEDPDRWLVERHEREIFPLLHRRHLFADAREFLLYDFFTADGRVNEDVFAYSNRSGDSSALVLYHNRFASTSGWIRESAAFAVKGPGGERTPVRRSLGEALGLGRGDDRFCVFREHLSGLEFVRRSSEIHEQGLYADLEAYRCQVFLDFREVVSTAAEPWAEVAGELGGRGTPSSNALLQRLRLRPVVDPFRRLVNAETLRELASGQPLPAARKADFEARFEEVVRGASRFAALEVRDPAAGHGYLDRVGKALGHEPTTPATGGGGRTDAPGGGQGPHASHDGDPVITRRARRAISATLRALDERVPGVLRHARAWTWDREIAVALQHLGVEPWIAARAADSMRVAAAQAAAFRAAPARREGLATLMAAWAADADVRDALRVNLHEGTWWFGKEELEALVLELVALAELEDPSSPDPARRLGEKLQESARACGYQFDRWIARNGAAVPAATSRVGGPAPETASRTGPAPAEDAPKPAAVPPTRGGV